MFCTFPSGLALRVQKDFAGRFVTAFLEEA
jgi:hypothetical protein